MSEQNTLPPPGESHELPIGQILAILWRGRWIIAICVLLAVGLGLAYVIRRGTIWRASSRLAVESSTPVTAALDSLMMGAGGKNYVNTQGEILRSSEVLREALKRDALMTNPIFAEVELRDRQAWLKKALKVSVGRKDEIITVSLDSRFKEEACEVVNGVVESYMDFYSKRNKTKAESIVSQLAGQLARLEEKGKKLRADRDEFNSENPGFTLDGSNLILSHKLQELQSAVLRAEAVHEQALEAYAEGEVLAKDPESLREILRLRGGVGVGPGTERLKSDLRKQIWELDNRRSLLLAEVTPLHPAVRAIDKEIEGLETQIREIENSNKATVNRYVDMLRAKSVASKQALQASRSKLAEAQAELDRLSVKQLRFQELEKGWADHSNLVTSLKQTFEQFSLADVQGDKAETPLNITVIDHAEPRNATVASSRAMTLAIFLVLGLMAGFGLAWLRGIFDQRLRTVEDVTAGVQVALLGSLPRVALAENEKQDALLTWDRHESLAEAARSLRTAVYFGLPKGEGRCIQVTSPESGDGKSTIASNLAIAMAQAGQRTILVDADLRRPRQFALFGLDQVPGLATALASGQRVEELIQKSTLENLDILTSGPIPANPAEILNSEAFGELLDQLANQYDRVIVDSPPVLPVADARIIATKCDVTLMTLRVDRSTRKRAIAALESLQSVSARVLGAVLNDMPKGIGYGYGGYYGGRYGYGGHGYKSHAPAMPQIASSSGL